MHPSGVIAVSSIDRGTFFLRFDKGFPNRPDTPAHCSIKPTESPTKDEEDEDSAVIDSGAAIGLVVGALAISLALGFFISMKKLSMSKPIGGANSAVTTGENDVSL